MSCERNIRSCKINVTNVSTPTWSGMVIKTWSDTLRSDILCVFIAAWRIAFQYEGQDYISLLHKDLKSFKRLIGWCCLELYCVESICKRYNWETKILTHIPELFYGTRRYIIVFKAAAAVLSVSRFSWTHTAHSNAVYLRGILLFVLTDAHASLERGL